MLAIPGDEERVGQYVAAYRRAYLEEADNEIEEGMRARLDKYPYLKWPLAIHVGSDGWAWEANPHQRYPLRVRASALPIDEWFSSVARPNYPLSLTTEKRGTIITANPKGAPVEGAAPFKIGDAANVRVIGITFEDYPTIFHVDGEGGDISFVECPWSKDGLRTSIIHYARVFARTDVSDLTEVRATRDATREIYQALVDVDRASKRDVTLEEYLDQFKTKTVLILGSFGKGRADLTRIKDGVREAGYDPVTLDELPEHESYDLKQKFVAVASVARFLIFEDSIVSGHLVEMALAEPFHPVRVVMWPQGAPPSTYMSATDFATTTTMRLFEYEPDMLAAAVTDALEWAEARLAEAGRDASSMLPWREASASPPAFKTDDASQG